MTSGRDVKVCLSSSSAWELIAAWKVLDVQKPTSQNWIARHLTSGTLDTQSSFTDTPAHQFHKKATTTLTLRDPSNLMLHKDELFIWNQSVTEHLKQSSLNIWNKVPSLGSNDLFFFYRFLSLYVPTDTLCINRNQKIVRLQNRKHYKWTSVYGTEVLSRVK